MTALSVLPAIVVFVLPFAIYRAEQGMQRKQAERDAMQKRIEEVLGGQR